MLIIFSFILILSLSKDEDAPFVTAAFLAKAGIQWCPFHDG